MLTKTCTVSHPQPGQRKRRHAQHLYKEALQGVRLNFLPNGAVQSEADRYDQRNPRQTAVSDQLNDNSRNRQTNRNPLSCAQDLVESKLANEHREEGQHEISQTGVCRSACKDRVDENAPIEGE